MLCFVAQVGHPLAGVECFYPPPLTVAFVCPPIIFMGDLHHIDSNYMYIYCKKGIVTSASHLLSEFQVSEHIACIDS